MDKKRYPRGQSPHHCKTKILKWNQVLGNGENDEQEFEICYKNQDLYNSRLQAEELTLKMKWGVTTVSIAITF